MRIIFAAAITAALGLAVTAGYAADTAQQGTMKSCAASWGTMKADDKAKTKYKDYMSTCMKAAPKTAAAPAPAAAMAMKPAPAMAMKATPAKASSEDKPGQAKCKDGKTVSFKHRSGTCSGHGGVATWL